jgi:hypothetical protein
MGMVFLCAGVPAGCAQSSILLPILLRLTSRSGIQIRASLTHCKFDKPKAGAGLQPT